VCDEVLARIQCRGAYLVRDRHGHSISLMDGLAVTGDGRLRRFRHSFDTRGPEGGLALNSSR